MLLYAIHIMYCVSMYGLVYVTLFTSGRTMWFLVHSTDMTVGPFEFRLCFSLGATSFSEKENLL